MNKVLLYGNIGRDPESRTLDGGSKVTNFSVATNESYKDKAGEWQKQVQWHNIVTWGKLADYAVTLSKGDAVLIEGKIRTRTFEDKSGNNRIEFKVVANSVKVVNRSQPKQQQQSNNDALPW